MEELKTNDYKVATRLIPFGVFWPAEEYHRDYYGRRGTSPYCHAPVKRFDN